MELRQAAEDQEEEEARSFHPVDARYVDPDKLGIIFWLEVDE